MSNRTIPTVDLSKFVHGNAEERKAFVDKLGKAFHEVGFVGVVNHGINKELVDGFYNASKEFFSQPVHIKRKYEIAGLAGQRGYTAFGREHAKQSQVADLKEFFQIGQWVDDSHPLKHEYPDNVNTVETPDFYNKGKENENRKNNSATAETTDSMILSFFSVMLKFLRSEAIKFIPRR